MFKFKPWDEVKTKESITKCKCSSCGRVAHAKEVMPDVPLIIAPYIPKFCEECGTKLVSEEAPLLGKIVSIEYVNNMVFHSLKYKVRGEDGALYILKEDDLELIENAI
jgi:hypothetical protein